MNLFIECSTPEQAATALYNHICKYEISLEGHSHYVFLWSPEESRSRGYGNGWSVCWEEGPYEWAIYMSMGKSIFAGEFSEYSSKEENGIFDRDEWIAEPYNSFILSFYNN